MLVRNAWIRCALVIVALAPLVEAEPKALEKRKAEARSAQDVALLRALGRLEAARLEVEENAKAALLLEQEAERLEQKLLQARADLKKAHLLLEEAEARRARAVTKLSEQRSGGAQ